MAGLGVATASLGSSRKKRRANRQARLRTGLRDAKACPEPDRRDAKDLKKLGTLNLELGTPDGGEERRAWSVGRGAFMGMVPLGYRINLPLS